MRVQEQVLSPGVQDADEADLRTEPLRVGGDFEHSGGAGAEKQVVQKPGIALAERVQLVRQSKDDVEVAARASSSCSRGREPALPRLCLTLRAMTVAAGVIRDGLMTASRNRDRCGRRAPPCGSG